MLGFGGGVPGFVRRLNDKVGVRRDRRYDCDVDVALELATLHDYDVHLALLDPSSEDPC